jgi:hypothetical protein
MARASYNLSPHMSIGRGFVCDDLTFKIHCLSSKGRHPDALDRGQAIAATITDAAILARRESRKRLFQEQALTLEAIEQAKPCEPGTVTVWRF